MIKHLLTISLLLGGLLLAGKEFALIENGEVKGCIVRLRGSSAVELAAAAELVDYVEKITAKRLSRLRRPPAGKYPIYIALADTKNLPLPQRAKKELEKVKENGFLLYAGKEGLFITAKEKIALRYAVAEILKRYGKVRWITPGPEGEFYPKSSSFTVPELCEAVNPSFLHRKFNLVSAWGYTLTPLWQVRNNMTRTGILFGGKKELGGHCFSSLLPDIHFKEKPYLYGLYNGKRLPQCGDEKKIFINGGRGGQKNQPCTSNAETIRIMQENLVRELKANPQAESYCILNNDSTKWCECENCRKLDPPEEKKRGMVSTRFWLLANALIEAGKKAAPHVRFFSSPYQNFQEYPCGVKPDKRAEINFCLHHRCYLHSIGDSKCYINERYRQILRKWHTEKRKVQTYEYTNVLPRGKVWYLPMAPLIHKDLKYYHAIGNDGWCDEVSPYDGNFTANAKRIDRERWKGGALDLYLIARMLWDVNMDYAKEEEEAGSLYYGKAWKDMKKFRHLLFQSYAGINDHFVYGSRLWQLGRALEPKGTRELLLHYLAEAEKAAKGDPRVEKIVARDKEFFHLTFIKGQEEFRKNHRSNGVRAGEYSKEDPSSWTLSDIAYAGSLLLQFQYGKDRLYVRYGAFKSRKEGKLELITEKERKIFPLSRKGGLLTFPLQKVKEGESMNLGAVFHCNGEKISWNGKGTAAPGVFRKLHFGSRPILKNGDFADFTIKNGKKVLTGFGSKGNFTLIEDPLTAAAGKNFLRGNGVIFQYLHGLQGPTQTYGIPRIFRGKLKILAKFRGRGRMSFRLSTSKMKLVKEAGMEVDSPGKWQEKEMLVDCKDNKDPLLLLYIFCSKGKEDLELDDVRVKIQK